MSKDEPGEHFAQIWAFTSHSLDLMAKESHEAAVNAALHWLWDDRYRQPSVAILEEQARSDAMFWSETASTTELECYMLAACMRLQEGKSMFHRKHIKRLVASLWKRMWPEDQEAFIAWAKENKNEKEQ